MDRQLKNEDQMKNRRTPDEQWTIKGEIQDEWRTNTRRTTDEGQTDKQWAQTNRWINNK